MRYLYYPPPGFPSLKTRRSSKKRGKKIIIPEDITAKQCSSGHERAVSHRQSKWLGKFKPDKIPARIGRASQSPTPI